MYAGEVSGPFFSEAISVSWPKNGISRADSRALNAMRSASEWIFAPGASFPRYALRSALNS